MTAATLTKCAENWCTDHLDADDGVAMHAAQDVRVPMTAGGPREQMNAVVVTEWTVEDGRQAHVRLELDGVHAFLCGAPMTPQEALRLASELTAAARTAMGAAR